MSFIHVRLRYLGGFLICLGGVFFLPDGLAMAADTPAQILEKSSRAGEFKQGIAQLETELAARPAEAEARFALGLLQFLGAIDEFAATQYKFGAGGGTARSLELPFFRGIPNNPDPAPVKYADTQALFAQLGKSLAIAEKTLAGVEQSQVKLPFRPGLVAFDLNRDGKIGDEESFWSLLRAVVPPVGQIPKDKFLIQVDEGDAVWLRGYCHLLMAFCDVSAAYDTRELFERTGHMIYAKPVTPYPWSQEPEGDANNIFTFHRIADLIAMIHLINFELVDADKMRSAHAHLLEMIRLSRISWKLIDAESDDDAEWVPNDRQKSVAIGLRISRDQITGWHHVLEEIEALLNGKKLIPFWRGDLSKSKGERGRGVNLAKVFQQPGRFDMVLWITGTGAAPYIEEGQLSTDESWNRLQAVFGGRFFGFAAWFN
ncbi:MAG: hypothetical protein C0478_04410 [Planctomyces sp.]|nr:hypothetical protein [Planctomyces sp.]